MRKFTAEKLYVAMMTIDDDELVEELAQASEILTVTTWDGEITAARTQRNLICDLLGLPKPKVKAKAAKPKAPEKDDLDSYRDLVDRSGY